jgi:predicted choloylglycine hydrolase
MRHDHYFEIDAKSHFALGLRKGELFGEFLRKTINREKRDRAWPRYVRLSKDCLEITADHFPDLIDEYKGYAQGASVTFEDLWALDLMDELSDIRGDHCTTVVTNNGFLTAHNEDWSASAANDICILKRTVGDLKAFELFYLNTLGGNSMSINSKGIVHSVNSLEHKDQQLGVPKNVMARWISDTDSPEDAFKMLSKVPRAGGYHHTLVNALGKVWSFECSAKMQEMNRPSTPFVHTNHYLSSKFEDLEKANDGEGTFRRYRTASDMVTESMTMQSAEQLLSESTQGGRSIFNRRTIGRMIVDTDHMVAHVWLARERKKGWIAYDIQF